MLIVKVWSSEEILRATFFIIRNCFVFVNTTDEYGNIVSYSSALAVDTIIGVSDIDQYLGAVALYPIPTCSFGLQIPGSTMTPC